MFIEPAAPKILIATEERMYALARAIACHIALRWSAARVHERFL
jgi:hypothetical protein